VAAARVIAVTGASRGIGSAIAEELAQRGYLVGCLSRKGEGPEDRPVDAALKPRLIPLTCDVTHEADIKAALAALAERGGGLHGLVNNAGMYREATSDACSTSAYEETMATNATAVFVACRESYPHLVASGGGIIVNIGSLFDKTGVKTALAYCASKAAVGAMTRCLAVEWAGQDIRVLNVAPGVVATDLNHKYMTQDSFRRFLKRRIPGGVPGTPEQIARLVGALFDQDMPFLTGETIYIDGGQGVAY